MIITQTPLRISFFGGGTDFPDFFQQEEGCVLSSAIDKFIFVIVKRRFDDMIRLGYTRTELVEDVEQIQHNLVREALKVSGVNRAIEIGTLGDIPSTGSGLGSSSTVTVGTLNALYTYLNNPCSLEELAQKACEIEMQRLNKPVGKQDQYIVSYGGFRFIRFLPDGSVKVESLRLSESSVRRFSERLMLFYTHQPRSSEMILAEQRNNIHLNTDALRELKKMAIQARGCIEAGEFDTVGNLLHESWQVKKSLASKISNPDLDEMYNAARKAGALGGKITGAGGGGFLLLYCPQEKQAAVRKALDHLKELPFQLENNPSKVIFDYRR